MEEEYWATVQRSYLWPLSSLQLQLNSKRHANCFPHQLAQQLSISLGFSPFSSQRRAVMTGRATIRFLSSYCIHTGRGLKSYPSAPMSKSQYLCGAHEGTCLHRLRNIHCCFCLCWIQVRTCRLGSDPLWLGNPPGAFVPPNPPL